MMLRILVLGLFILVSLSCSKKNDVDKLRFLERGNLAYSVNEIEEAIRFYDEALIKDSSFVDAWNNKGLALMKIAGYDDAIYCFDQAIKFKPDYKEALLNNTRANLAVHQHYSALNNIEDLARLLPDTSIIHFTRGLIFADMNEAIKALEEFRLALSKDSLNTETWVNIANIYYHQNRPDSAILYVQAAIKLEASQPDAYNVLAMVYSAKNQYEDGLKAINTAISLREEDAYFHNNKGFILMHLNRLSEAEESIVTSMKIDPYNAWVYRNLGLVRFASGNDQEAARLLEKALKIDNSIDNIYVDLALAYQKLGDINKACKLLTSALNSTAVAVLRKDLCE